MEFEGKELPLEEAIKNIEKIVAKLEEGKQGLEEGLNLYRKGMKLCFCCEKKLKDARMEIEYFNNDENLEE